ncbi:MAG: hypothetical protein ABSF46_10075 [Terriglobia bacterium]
MKATKFRAIASRTISIKCCRLRLGSTLSLIITATAVCGLMLVLGSKGLANPADDDDSCSIAGKWIGEFKNETGWSGQVQFSIEYKGDNEILTKGTKGDETRSENPCPGAKDEGAFSRISATTYVYKSGPGEMVGSTYCEQTESKLVRENTHLRFYSTSYDMKGNANPSLTVSGLAHRDIGDVEGRIEPGDLGNILYKAAEGLSQYKASHDLDPRVRKGPLRKGPIPADWKNLSEEDLKEHLESLNCQFFFRQVGKELQQRLQEKGSTLGDEWTNPDIQANDIASLISRSENWKAVGADEAQEYADRGAFVEGVQIHQPNGHLATVSPAPPGVDPCKFDGHGPLIQDGNEHYVPAARADGAKQDFPSSWGVVKASKAFSGTPTYYVWVPSVK